MAVAAMPAASCLPAASFFGERRPSTMRLMGCFKCFCTAHTSSMSPTPQPQHQV